MLFSFLDYYERKFFHFLKESDIKKLKNGQSFLPCSGNNI